VFLVIGQRSAPTENGIYYFILKMNVIQALTTQISIKARMVVKINY
jgi:hypothetical protein